MDKEAEIEDLNPGPLYIGQPPSYISAIKGAEGLLSRLVIFKSTLTTDAIQALTRMDTSGLPKSIFHEEKCLDVISLFDKTLKLLPAMAIKVSCVRRCIEVPLASGCTNNCLFACLS